MLTGFKKEMSNIKSDINKQPELDQSKLDRIKPGDVFGNLVIVGYEDKNNYSCKCVCGN